MSVGRTIRHKAQALRGRVTERVGRANRDRLRRVSRVHTMGRTS
ncbi:MULTISPECIES: hypothetical protein [unclassified Streptomyces]|jgi:hypothetical protein